MFGILLGLGGLRLAPPWNLDTSSPSAEALDTGSILAAYDQWDPKTTCAGSTGWRTNG